MSKDDELQALITQMREGDTEMARRAVDTLRERGWLTDSLRGADLRRAKLSGANLQGAMLEHANLSEADLSTANLFSAALHGSILSEAKLSNANLSLAELSSVKLNNANLSSANLSRTNLFNSDLSESVLSRASLVGALLYGTNMKGAKLDAAKLNLAILINTLLDETDFTGATCGETIFARVDLSKAKGLATIEHRSPSFLDFATLQRSQGDDPIPEVFLRGCGLSDDDIQFVIGMYGKAIQYYSCFISYSTQNQDFADRLYADLQNNNVRCWFASEDLKIGDKFQQEIDMAIRIRDKLLIILSEESLASDWVEDEVQAALEEERRTKRTILFPIRIDDAAMDSDVAWASKIRRTRHIGDFTQWKDHDSYQKAFERLLRDLKADDSLTSTNTD